LDKLVYKETIKKIKINEIQLAETEHIARSAGRPIRLKKWGDAKVILMKA